METMEEALGLLMETHFPSRITTHVVILELRGNGTDKAPKDDIKNVKSFKAAEPDMVFPALLQK